MPNYFAPYGTFRHQAGEPDTPAFRHLRHVGGCLIPGRLYQMGAYPALKPGHGAVRGELFELPWLFDFAALDRYENYHPAKPWACRYVRRRIRLLEPAVVAWVYVYAWPVDRSTSSAPATGWRPSPPASASAASATTSFRWPGFASGEPLPRPHVAVISNRSPGNA
jgi:gamma-glutamylcyclotransferase (GGCT)/AIG2-like uncharacterized protein YtfP